jgi:uncharacterized protein YndB with AHSA1/START domain
MTSSTTVERMSERELAITRTFNGLVRVVYEAWTKPALLKRWWAPKSSGMSLVTCEANVRAGGKYRFVFGKEGMKPMEFFGRYLEVTPELRLVWTNDEGEDGGAVTTVAFEEKGAQTEVVVSELYPSKEALDAAIASDMEAGMRETHDQLDELLVALAASARPATP